MVCVKLVHVTGCSEIFYDRRQTHAEMLRRLGETARACPYYGCKRPSGHAGNHYFSETDYLNDRDRQALRNYR